MAWDAVCAKMERDDYKRFSVQFRNDVNRLQVRRRPIEVYKQARPAQDGGAARRRGATSGTFAWG